MEVLSNHIRDGRGTDGNEYELLWECHVICKVHKLLSQFLRLANYKHLLDSLFIN